VRKSAHNPQSCHIPYRLEVVIPLLEVRRKICSRRVNQQTSQPS
jgi:hypothetical protein